MNGALEKSGGAADCRTQNEAIELVACEQMCCEVQLVPML